MKIELFRKSYEESLQDFENRVMTSWQPLKWLM